MATAEDLVELLRRDGRLAARQWLRDAQPEVRAELIEHLLARALPDRERAAAQDAMVETCEAWRPETDAELWQLIRDECGIAVPRKAVCPGHTAPFRFVADTFFERGNPEKIVVGNRDSGKTRDMAIVHALNGRYKPGHEGATVASQAQARRCYTYFTQTISQPYWNRYIDPQRVTISQSTFRSGARVEIVVGTPQGVNSPHPNLVHIDEYELMKPAVDAEAQHMAHSSDQHSAQNVRTSSWKRPSGLVTRAVEAAKRGIYDLHLWCIWETAEPCQEDCAACPFRGVVSGSWPDGSPRSFEQVCKRDSPVAGVGKLRFSDGFVKIGDLLRRFQTMSLRQWESQQESRRPTLEGLVYDVFDGEAHTCTLWEPCDPDTGEPYGEVTVGVDFGGSNPFAIQWWQELRVAVELDGRYYPEGTHVCFDEIYVRDVGDVTAGMLYTERLAEWQRAYPALEVEWVFCDPAASAARRNWRHLAAYGGGRDIPTRAHGGVKVEDRVKELYELIHQGRVVVDEARCKNFLIELGATTDLDDAVATGSYERDPQSGRLIDQNNHACDAAGYRLWGVMRLKARGDAGSVEGAAAKERGGLVQARVQKQRYDGGGVPVAGAGRFMQRRGE